MASERKQESRSEGGRSGANGDGRVAQQLDWEKRDRARFAVPALAGGVLYLLSTIVINATLSGAPTVGLLQGIKPALTEGIVEPARSPRAAEVVFVSHHTFPLIAGSGLMALSLLALTGALLLLARAARFRRPESFSATPALVLLGGIGFAVAAIGHQIATAVLTHQFAIGSDFSGKAVEEALTVGPANLAAEYVSLIAGLALVVGMINACLNAMRVGLLTRWMGIVGMLSAVLIFLPIGGPTLDVVPAFWLAAMGILYMGRWPGGDPPAWAAGQARPWPTQADRIAEREGRKGKGAGSAGAAAEDRQLAPAGAGGAGSAVDANGGAPAPAPPRSQGSGRRRRKRGSRR